MLRKGSVVTIQRGSFAASSGIADAKRSRWSGITEVLLNLIGCVGFTVGSMLFLVPNLDRWGSIVFGVASALCGLACTIYGVKAVRGGDPSSGFAFGVMSSGAYIFAVHSFTFLYESLYVFSLIGFALGSLGFLIGSLNIVQISDCQLGPLSPFLLTVCRDICPNNIINVLASALFVGGSELLAFETQFRNGLILYLAGSILFTITSWGDLLSWHREMMAFAARRDELHTLIQEKPC